MFVESCSLAVLVACELRFSEVGRLSPRLNYLSSLVRMLTVWSAIVAWCVSLVKGVR